MALSTIPQPKEGADEYQTIMSLVGTLSGLSNWSAHIDHIGFDSDSRYAHVLDNQGTGGHLNIPNELQVESDGTGVVARMFTATSLVAVTLSVTGNTTLGDAAGDTLTVNATSTFASPFSTTAATNLGNANADALTVIATSTFRNAANSATQLYVDPANHRVLVGTGTALTGTASSMFEVTGIVYLTPASAGEVALNIWRSPSAGSGWGVGVTSTDQLKFTDNGGQGIFTIGDTSSTYQAEVTGDFHVTDDSLFTGDVEMVGNLTGTTGTFDWQNSGNSRLKINSTGVGFFGSTPIAKPTVVGAKGGNVALGNLMSALANLGLVTDSTTA